MIVQLFNNSIQMNSFCSDFFDIEASVALFKMAKRSGGTETI